MFVYHFSRNTAVYGLICSAIMCAVSAMLPLAKQCSFEEPCVESITAENVMSWPIQVFASSAFWFDCLLSPPKLYHVKFYWKFYIYVFLHACWVTRLRNMEIIRIGKKSAAFRWFLYPFGSCMQAQKGDCKICDLGEIDLVTFRIWGLKLSNLSKQQGWLSVGLCAPKCKVRPCKAQTVLWSRTMTECTLSVW